ncbi:MAG: FkbM family methyltransferase [Candidatus Hydrogenedentes bacterium]|nr:FkbM family methyltransferase [Candidatus Hydrogenedentota bacterium]
MTDRIGMQIPSVTESADAAGMGFPLTRLKFGELARPLITRLPRGRHFLYKRILGPFLSTNLADAFLRERLSNAHRIFFDPGIGAYIIADLRDWCSRGHYFSAKYYDQLVPQLIRRFLGRGGIFVDVGANRGIHALCAARVLRRTGHVYAFEPNPAAFSILQAHLAINEITNCTTFNMGLSDRVGELSLRCPHHSGAASFVDTCPVEDLVTVQVQTLERALGALPQKERILVKVDTEGFEHHVLTGMGALLKYSQLLVACEITDEWLAKAGSSAVALFSFMRDRGYRAYEPVPDGTDYRLVELVSPLDRWQYDVVFIRGQLEV